MTSQNINELASELVLTTEFENGVRSVMSQNPDDTGTLSGASSAVVADMIPVLDGSTRKNSDLLALILTPTDILLQVFTMVQNAFEQTDKYHIKVEFIYKGTSGAAPKASVVLTWQFKSKDNPPVITYQRIRAYQGTTTFFDYRGQAGAIPGLAVTLGNMINKDGDLLLDVQITSPGYVIQSTDTPFQATAWIADNSKVDSNTISGALLHSSGEHFYYNGADQFGLNSAHFTLRENESITEESIPSLGYAKNFLLRMMSYYTQVPPDVLQVPKGLQYLQDYMNGFASMPQEFNYLKYGGVPSPKDAKVSFGKAIGVVGGTLGRLAGKLIKKGFNAVTSWLGFR